MSKSAQNYNTSNTNFNDLPSNNETIFLYPSIPSEIYSIIKNLNLSQSDKNEFPAKLFKLIAFELSSRISNLINTCMTTGKYPDLLKIARVIPIFKKGSPSEPQNYRPISILPNLNKIIEKVLYIRISQFADRYCLIPANQNGFVKI